MKAARYFLLGALVVFVWSGIAADLDARDAAAAIEPLRYVR